MKIRTKVRKKHLIKMDDKELGTLVEMLKRYDKNLASKLPDGTPTDELAIIRSLYSLRHGTYYRTDRED
jgi:hypothetical protein